MNSEKHQMHALQIVSAQHELAMAIGNHIELDKMLRHFLMACIQRLNLISAHAFLYNDDHGWPQSRDQKSKNASPPVHYLSMPAQQDGLDRDLNHGQLQPIENAASHCYQQLDGAHLYNFSLPEHGNLLLQVRTEIDPTFLDTLQPIFSRLAKSCHNSIVHESLLREMQAREDAERNLQHRALHNIITELPNRQLLAQTIDLQRNKAGSNACEKALLCIEIENLRKVTAIMDHTLGDKIQQRFSQILRNLVRDGDIISQSDTDTFLVLIDKERRKETSLHDVTHTLCKSIQSSIAEPLNIGSHPIMLSIRTGYDVFQLSNCNTEKVIRRAEIAKSEAVRQCTKQAIAYCDSLQELVDNRIRMESALKKSIINKELALWWQPQYNSAHRLIGAEALLRWNNPEWGMVSPGIFIPLAEESDLIEKLGNWVLQTACEQLAEILPLGLPGRFEKLSINVSPRQLVHTAFVDNLLALIEQHNIPKGLLGIELTESTLVQNFEQTVALISKLKDVGVECSLDDFGTGYSSLSYLKKLPIKTIKIDQSFVRDIHLSAGDQAIAKTLIFLGKNLQKDIIAEGVETKEELQCLVDMGCEQFQGYYYDRPAPLETLKERWYNRDKPAAKIA